MKHAILLLGAATLFQQSVAHPGHGKQWAKKLVEIKERAARPPDGPNDSNELLGDLVAPGPSTEVGKVIVLATMTRDLLTEYRL
jgi:hypothetical protein